MRKGHHSLFLHGHTLLLNYFQWSVLIHLFFLFMAWVLSGEIREHAQSHAWPKACPSLVLLSILASLLTPLFFIPPFFLLNPFMAWLVWRVFRRIFEERKSNGGPQKWNSSKRR